jgi:hypothetical protein
MFLAKVPDGPPIFKFGTSSGSKKKEPSCACQKKSLKVPGKGAPLHVPPKGSPRREMLRLQSQWFIHSFISVGVTKKGALLRKRGNHTVTVHGAPSGRKANIQWGAAWFPKGIVFDTAITTPVPCRLQHDKVYVIQGTCRCSFLD